MLPPDSRTTAFELIRPPSGYRLDFAVLTTYTLDLEALLVLPLSVLAHPDGGLEELLADPLRLHQAIDPGRDLLGLEHPARTHVAARLIAFRGPQHRDAPVEQREHVRPGRVRLPHLLVHRRREHQRCGRREA